ncbi:MAG: 5'/3'-nucleotidase SurE [Muribaculaceae bacterium]
MTDNKLIFISNDDGYNARGLRNLVEWASDYGYVYAVAPAEHQSGKSSAITIDTPLRATTIEKTQRYTIMKVNGTPTDCAKLAFNCLLPRKPDLVLSGINHGYNAGNSVIYSGTMGVVFEGCFQQLPSIGFSFSEFRPDANFSVCEPVVRSVIERVLDNELPNGVGLNVNIPNAQGGVKGIKATIASRGRWIEEFEKRTDPFGRDYYWITGRFENDDANNPLTDFYQLERGYASITPCTPEQTHEPSVELVRNLFE